MTICLEELVSASFVNCARDNGEKANLKQGAFHPRDKSLGFHASRDKPDEREIKKSCSTSS